MLPIPKTDRDVIHHLWITGHGPTGFRCRCGCLVGYPRGDLGRSKVCRDCGAEISVTADTLMRGTRLPLLAWIHVLHCREDLPTARELASEFDIAIASAWHLVQRVVRWVAGSVVGQFGHSEVARIALRPAVAPMDASAPAHIVALDSSAASEVDVQLDLAADHAWCGPIGLGAPDSSAHPVWAWLLDKLRKRGNVSLRWLPRWVAAFLGLWRFAHGEGLADWAEAVRRTPPVPLRRLDPWLG